MDVEYYEDSQAAEAQEDAADHGKSTRRSRTYLQIMRSI